MTAPLKGLLAFNKPVGISSIKALHYVRRILGNSPIFAETIAEAKRKRKAEIRSKRAKRPKSKIIDIRIGHGGTLDPLASGVMVTGIGDGTKHLQQFLECPKTYEVVALFGCATDTYHATGKVVKWAAYRHITRAAVEEALEAFRGDMIQQPPIYSALYFNGKRLYEYAREGKKLPLEMKARPVTCELLELVDFTTNHSWDFPQEEASKEDKFVCAALEKQEAEAWDEKHAREEVAGDVEPAANKKKALKQKGAGVSLVRDYRSNLKAASRASEEPRPPAITLRMTVSTTFRVRSLIHDLGEALGSAAHMVKLVRTRQGQFEIGKNVVEWTDLKSEDTLKAWKEEQKME